MRLTLILQSRQKVTETETVGRGIEEQCQIFEKWISTYTMRFEKRQQQFRKFHIMYLVFVRNL